MGEKKKKQLQIIWCYASINHTFLCEYVHARVEEFTECDIILSQYILSILILVQECLKLEKWFKRHEGNSRENAMPDNYLEHCLKQISVDWRIHLVA